jgi:hypothetical protein
MHSDLLALADDGKIYNWSWEKQAKPSNKPHQSMEKLLGNDSLAGLMTYSKNSNL